MQIILTGIVIAIMFTLGLAVFLNNRKRPVNIVFSLFVLAIIGWTVSNFLADYIRVVPGALFWVRSSFAFSSAILTILSGIFIFLFSFSPLLVKTVELKSWGANTVNGPYFWAFPIYFLLIVFASFAILIRRYRHARGRRRQQIQYLFFGLALGFFFGSLLNLFLPLITGTTNLAKFGPFGTVFLIFFTAVAIVKHRLLDIRILILKSVAYAVTLTILVAAYVSITYLLLRQPRLAISPTLIDIGTLFVLVFTFNPLRELIEIRTDRLFFKHHYGFNELLGKLSNITKEQSRSISNLTRQLLTTLTEEMQLTKAGFIIADNQHEVSIMSVNSGKHPDISWKQLLKATDNAKTALVLNDLDEGTIAKKALRDVEMEVLLPIKTERERVAALALGGKKSGDPFSEEDIRLLELIGPQIALALENARSFFERGRRIAELQSINKLFRHIEHFLNLDKLLQEIVDEAILATRADGGSLMLADNNGKTLSIKTYRNLSPVIALNTKVKVGEGIAGTVAETHKPLIVNGRTDKEYHIFLRRRINSAISAPMIADNKLIGVLNVNRRHNQPNFTPENLNVMSAFAAQAAEAIVKAGNYRQIQRLSLQNDRQFREFVKALSRTVDAKDPYTFGHSEEVTRLCLEIAKNLGLDQESTRAIEIGSRLHDMGKIGIPEAILNKPGRLTEEEYAQVKHHPEIAADILRDTESLKNIRELILYHHERYDGTGYPAGLKGEQIPLGSRILGVADAYDAMRSHRAYRDPLPQEVAVAELKKNAGAQFDPQIVDIFLKTIGHENKSGEHSLSRRKQPPSVHLKQIKKKAA